MLELLTSKVLPRHLGIIFDRMDEAAERGTSIDVSQLLVKYVFAVFGDIAWDVSTLFCPSERMVCFRLSLA
jgi:hypothetical protein